MTDSVENADHVHNAQNVISAEHVGLARQVTLMPDPADGKTQRRKLERDILFGMVVLIALLYSFYTGFHQDTTANQNADILNDNAERSRCVGLYQDGVDASSTQILIDIGDMVVIITQVQPGPDRQAAVEAKVAELGLDKEAARKAVNAKGAYNDADRPLPCPIDQVAAIPPPTTTTTP